MKRFEQFVVEKANKGNEPIKITNKNFENLKNMVSGKTDTNKLDLDILADRTNSTTGKVRVKALPGQNPTPSEISGQNKIVQQQTPGTNVSVNPSKTNITKNTGTVTTNVTNTKNPITVDDYKSGSKIKTTKPQVTTNVTSPKKFKSFLDRVLVSTGVKTDPKYKSKFITPSSKVTVSGAKGGTNKVLSDVSKKALRSNIFKGCLLYTSPSPRDRG